MAEEGVECWWAGDNGTLLLGRQLASVVPPHGADTFHHHLNPVPEEQKEKHLDTWKRKPLLLCLSIFLQRPLLADTNIGNGKRAMAKERRL